jgi:hypothetical protein
VNVTPNLCLFATSRVEELANVGQFATNYRQFLLQLLVLVSNLRRFLS